MLCTSGFTDDVMFSYNGTNGPKSKTTRMFRPVRLSPGGDIGAESAVCNCILLSTHNVLSSIIYITGWAKKVNPMTKYAGKTTALVVFWYIHKQEHVTKLFLQVWCWVFYGTVAETRMSHYHPPQWAEWLYFKIITIIWKDIEPYSHVTSKVMHYFSYHPSICNSQVFNLKFIIFTYFTSLNLASRKASYIEYLTDRIFNNSLKYFTLMWYCVSHSNLTKASFTGTHFNTIGWEGSLFRPPCRPSNPN